MDSRTALLNAPLPLRLAAVVALPVALALAVGGVGVAVRASLDAGAAAIVERQMHLGRLQLLLATTPGPGGGERMTGPDGPEFLRGDSEALVQATFQNHLKEIAAASGVEVLAAGNTPIVERDGTRFAGLRASMTGTNDALVAAIFAIETAEPYLTIRSARLEAATEGAGSDDEAQELMLRIEFEGALPPIEPPAVDAAAPVPGDRR